MNIKASLHDKSNVVCGDITTASGIIVHGCNAMGVMGSGVAKAIRKKFPFAYKAYKDYQEMWGLRVGTIIVAHQPCGVVVVNAITQERYGNDGKQYVSYEAVKSCFASVALLAKRLAKYGDATVNYPLIGAGLGGGSWEVIEQIINTELAGLDHRLWIN